MNKTKLNNPEEDVIYFLEKDNDEIKCSSKCFKRAIKYTIAIGLCSILAFAVGFVIQPYLTRAIWLIITGVLTVLSGIVLFLLLTKSKSSQSDYSCIDLLF